MALGGALGLVLVARDAAALCVAGVAQSHIHLRFAWQAWHVWHWVARLGWFWSPGTPRHFAAALCVAGVAQGDIHLRFAWQAWRTLTSTFVLRGRRGTISHPPSFSWQAWHNLTHIFVTHLLSHTIFVTHHLSQSVVTHHLSYNLCQQFSHAHLCHTPPASHSSSSFTHTVTIATGICSKTVRQLWIEEHDVELQSTMRLIAAEERRKRRMLREGCPDSSDSD